MISSPSLVDARPHAEAVKAALNAALGPDVHAYDYDEVPGSDLNPNDEQRAEPVPDIFVVIAVSRRAAPPTRGGYTTGRTGWRIETRGAGTTTDECRWAMYKAAVALNEAVLTIDGTDTTPVTFESETEPQSDDGRISATALWVYAH